MPELDDQHIFSEHHFDCGEGMVMIGNRCVPAQSIVGDDHQVGGHHFRSETSEYHLHFNAEAEDDQQDDEEEDEDDYPFSDNPDDEPQEGDEDIEEEYDDEDQDPEEDV